MKIANYLIALSCWALMLTILSACKKDTAELPSPGYVLSAEEIEQISDNFCSTANAGGGAEDRATGEKGKFWPAGKVLRVKFMNGSHSMRHKVFDYAKMWEENANISFIKVDTGYSDIRVRFGIEGNNSQIGTDNQSVSQHKATMNLQINDYSSEDKIRRHSLHEFGHALGLAHEHQNPFANIAWDLPKVYAYFAQTEGWDVAMVNNNVLNNFGWGPAQHTDFDPQSIMLYPIPAALTTNGFSVPWNTQLSDKDKEFIGKMYAGTTIKIRHAANISGTITFSLNGVYTTLYKGESLDVPAQTGSNVFQIWECPNGCMWSAYYPALGASYKIVSSDPDNPLDLDLVPE